MDRYSVCWLQICPFDKINNGVLKPNREDYPYRLCVLDRQNSIAIDVKTEFSYNYILTSTVYFLNEESKKIEQGKRYAIMELHLSILEIEKEDYLHANLIVNKLKYGKEFINGNFISNEEYLKNIKNENNIDNKVVVKKKGKRIKNKKG